MKKLLLSILTVAVLAVTASLGTAAAPTKQVKRTPVTDENYSLAETDGIIEGYVKKIAAATNTNGVGVLMHYRKGADPKDRTIMRINFDTIYSWAIVDLTEPATLTMPETNGRYQSAWIVSEDGYYPGAFTTPGEHKITKEWIGGARYAVIVMRTQVNTKDPGDLTKAHALQDKLKLTQKDRGSWAPANQWDKKEVAAMRAKYQKIGDSMDTAKMFGKKGEISLKNRNAGNAFGWGGFTPDQAVYPQYFPKTAAPQTLTLKDVPVKAFWSITVYDKEGFPQTDTYNINSAFAQKDKDGSVTIHFGGDKKAKNYMETFDGWNFTLRMYQPTEAYSNGTWKKPELKSAKAAETPENDDKPNIVLINMDNFGYGELGVYGGGITRGAPTPRIDTLAREGLRLTNFNVEAQCTPSRAALMTGRYAKRTGNASVPLFTDLYGLTQWEYTMAEMLSDVGYATAMYGKWHLGNEEGRYPNDQGFDEWYGAPNSTDESAWPSQPRFMALVKEKVHPMLTPTYLLEGKKGEKSKPVTEWTLEQRREMDMVLTEKTMDFMQRQVKADKPFFVYLPYTLTHYPVLPSKEFQDKSGNGLWGDVLMQIDYNVGRLLDKIDKLGIKDNTIFIFTADNGAEMNPGYQGWAGPWSGTYFTAREGSLRVPFIMRWPGKVPADTASNEVVHQMDLFTTFAGIVGGNVPTDRIIDGVDQTDFFLHKQKRSNRDGFVIYVGEEIFGSKWRNYKMLTKHVIGGPGYESREWGYGNTVDGLAFYDLYADPKEEYPWTKDTPVQFWRRFPLTKLVADHAKSLIAEPPIKPGTQDPYVPVKKK